jgi:maltose-binding protein MalE
MKMQRSLVLFAMVAVVALFAVTSMPASQQASAHHKAHTASKGKISVHQVADPQAHGIPLLNATALKKELTKEVKGPYGESDVIGGMMSGGY